MILKGVFMIRVIVSFFAIFLLFGCQKIEVVQEGNVKKEPLQFKPGMVQCSECTMKIERYEYSGEVVAPDGKTYFFDDPGCLVLWLEKQDFKDEAVLWVYAMDTKRWIDAKKARYSLSDPTPMRYGFGAYEHDKEGFIGYDEMRLRMLRGENLANPKIRKRLLGQ